MTALLAKPESLIGHTGLELPSVPLTSRERGRPSVSPTGATGQQEEVVCWAAQGQAAGWWGTMVLAVAGGRCLVHDRARNTKQPSPGLCRPRVNQKGRNVFVGYFSLENNHFCRKCLSAANFQKEKKHTQKNRLVRIENKNLPDVPCSSLARPLEEILAEDREGKESQKTFEEKY